MRWPEILYRFGQQIIKIVEYIFITRNYGTVDLIRTPPKLFSVPDDLTIPQINTIPIFTKSLDIDSNIDWHLDLNSGRKFPLKFSKFINVRDTRLGSAKYVWEVNRLNFLLYFALQFSLTKNESFLTKIKGYITDWSEMNPYLLGINWYSNIEVNIRLIVFMFIWDIIDVNALCEKNKDFARFTNLIWIPLIYKHCKYSYSNPSKFSSANNHLISEGAGLFIASSYWHFNESGKWRNHSKNILEKEIINQHSPNGVNLEQAAEYIQFISDFFFISFIIDSKTTKSLSMDYQLRLEKIFEYIFNFTDSKCSFPKYGDEDDGHVVNFNFGDSNLSNNFSSLLISGGILFNKNKYIDKAIEFDTKNKIIFGEMIKKTDKVGRNVPLQESKFYRNEGHFFIRNYTRSKLEVFIHVNVAPLGFLAIAAHGHSDALSFSMNIGGEEVFIDSGTYSYYSDPVWRKYFIGTLAHNAVRIDGQNQASSRGPLLWTDHYTPEIINSETNESCDIITATHDGYSKLGCQHIREYEYNKKTLTLHINDEIKVFDGKEHLIEIPLHLHPDINVKKDITSFQLLTKNQVEIDIKTDDTLTTTQVYGSENPILGWYSKGFYKKEKTNVIYSYKKINSDCKIKTSIIIGK
jgi:hypothetical protein